MNDNVHGLIRCTNLEALIMRQAIFSRLHGVYQNSAAYLTWPSNRNQRFEHSLGTMKLAGDMLFAAVANADERDREAFLGAVAAEVDAILREASSKNVIDTYFKKSQARVKRASEQWESERRISSNPTIAGVLDKQEDLPLPDFSWRLVPGEAVSQSHAATCYLIVQAVRVAGMLHDVGHPPFSHAVEHALESLARRARDAECAFAGPFLGMMSSFEGEGKKTHEAMGDLLVRLLLSSVLDDLGDEGPDYAPLRIEYFVIWRLAETIYAERGAVGDVHALVASTVDADRLDFVRRDSMSSGLGQESVQYPRLVDGIKLVVSERDGEGSPSRFAFAFPTKAVDSIEGFLHQRYRNYDTMVWHHRVVKSDALLQHSLADLGLKALGQEVPQGRHLPSDASGLWMPFLGVESNGSVANRHIFGQWNDAWLVTTLSGEHIDLCVRMEEKGLGEEDELLRGRLAELLHSERHYLSLVKRFGDLEAVTDAFDNALGSLGKDVGEMRSTLLGCLGPDDGWATGGAGENAEDAGASARAFLELLPTTDPGDRIDSGRNPLVKLRKTFYGCQVTSDGPADYRDLVEGIVGLFFVQGAGGRWQALEHITVFRSLDSGVGDPVPLYYADGGMTELDRVSNVKYALLLEEESRPPFYVYVRLRDDKSLTSEREEEIRKSFLEHVGGQLAKWYTVQYDAFTKRATAVTVVDGSTSEGEKGTPNVQDCS